VLFRSAAYDYATLAAGVREGARTAVHTGAVRPTNADVVAAVQRNAIGISVAPGACANGPMAVPTAPNTGWVYITAGPGNTTTNAPAGQPAGPTAGGCDAVNPSYAGSYPLSVTVKYAFQPLTPLAQQFLGNLLVITVTSTMSTEY